MEGVEVKCGSCNSIVEPAEPDNKEKYEKRGALALGLLGVGIGSTIGIATAGLGIPATIPLGIIGAYTGLRAGRFAAEQEDGVTCPECGYELRG